jgi:hypothetical protein
LKLRDQYQPLKERHLVLHSDKYTLDEMIAKAKDWMEEEV